jgi:hypothetical protein
MNVIASEPGVMQRAYLKRMGQPTTEAQPVWGYVFYIRMQSEGLKHRKSVLRWSLYDRATGERIPGDDTANVETRSSTPSDTFVVPIWVQPPPDPAKKGYFVRFELYAQDTLLAIADSPSFANCTESSCGAPGG